MKKLFLLLLMIILFYNAAFANNDVKIWHDPSLNISSLKKYL